MAEVVSLPGARISRVRLDQSASRPAGVQLGFDCCSRSTKPPKRRNTIAAHLFDLTVPADRTAVVPAGSQRGRR